MSNVKYSPPLGRNVDFLVHPYVAPSGWNCDFVIRANQLLEGSAFFEGNVKKNGVSLGVALMRVFDSKTGQLVKEKLTDEVGNYYLDGLNGYNTYDVIAYDIDGAWEAKLFSKRTPAMI